MRERSSPVFRGRWFHLGRSSVHLRPSLVALDSKRSSSQYCPPEDLSSLPAWVGGGRSPGLREGGEGDKSNPSPHLHLDKTLLF